MANGRLICFDGGDATGKTTVAALVAHELRARGQEAFFLSKNSPVVADADLQRHLQQLGDTLWRYSPSAPVADWGERHWFHLIVSWFSLLDTACIRPALDRGQWLVVDGWTYKFRARFALKTSFSGAEVERAFAHVTRPDVVVVPQLAPELAARRREHFRASECGRFDGHHHTDPRVAFVEYQRRVLSVMDRLYDEPCMRFDAQSLAPTQLANDVCSALLRSQKSGHAAPTTQPLNAANPL
jgi:dTMP kinase